MYNNNKKKKKKKNAHELYYDWNYKLTVSSSVFAVTSFTLSGCEKFTGLLTIVCFECSVMSDDLQNIPEITSQVIFTISNAGTVMSYHTNTKNKPVII